MMYLLTICRRHDRIFRCNVLRVPTSVDSIPWIEIGSKKVGAAERALVAAHISALDASVVGVLCVRINSGIPADDDVAHAFAGERSVLILVER